MRLTHYRNHSRLSAAFYKSIVFTGRARLTPSVIAVPASIFTRRVRPAAIRTVGFSTTARAQHQQASMSTTEEKPEGIASQPAEVPKAEASKPEKEELPPLSDHEFKTYNRLAERMDLFHNHFRSSWNLLWGACTSGRRPQGMSLKQFIAEGVQFAEHLTTHHGIEETYMFPQLAKKMPEFKSGRGSGAAELLRQHREIHAGLDAFEEYLRQCRTGEVDFSLDVLRSKMESWGEVLWTHLDQEVKTLGAENMRRYWTKDEMRRLFI
ncbi:hypothetical protein G7Z17_g8674 [Cylindrodendrum hubeiense]|uniref:Hemerythrin-like domain-containing protein n=1 Tax=Cylindrodendrum hubeiense TaxID=595255 RepID=A0A9P5H4S3_9HYPO|nr:hypothetical protein G7Z17_g8674 [Cylindrodendrum hubeiense]